MADQNWNSMRENLLVYGQQHLLDHLDELTATEKDLLYNDLLMLDLPSLSESWKEVQATLTQHQTIKYDLLKPLDDEIVCSTTRDQDEIPYWWDIGLKKVSNNEVAVLLLAGGQGTRLKVPYPKGMYDVELLSRKTLFQLQAERIIKLQQLAKKLYARDCIIPWYIMTSQHTKAQTMMFFEENKFFGLDSNDIIVFEQDTLPCLDFNGKILLAEKYRITQAPNGNGGVYTALAGSSNAVLLDMESRGVTSIHVYCVDNILVRVADPVFIGFCWDKGAECGAKVVQKTVPTEKVGVICSYGDHYHVTEYSEISSHAAEMRNSDGSLMYSAGNIANHFFTLDFLRKVSRDHKAHSLSYHISKKNIPCVNREGQKVELNGIKLEKFVFDVFQFAKSFCVLEVSRDEEFSPVKNAPGADVDTPVTARADVFDLHHKWVLSNGGTIVDSAGVVLSKMESNSDENPVVEISPLVSYGGEGLMQVCAGRTFSGPLYLDEDFIRTLAID